MSNRLVIDGNTVYEIDVECVRQTCGAMALRNLPGRERPEDGGRDDSEPDFSDKAK